MSARDIIASCILGGSTFVHEDRLDMGDEALSALTSSGYRILAPGEMDRIKAEERERGRIEGIEAAAKVAHTHVIAPENGDMSQEDWWAHAVANGRAKRIAAAIRALGGGEG